VTRRVLVFLVFSLFPAHDADAKFYAAAGKADITPDLKTETVWLAGYGASGRRPAGVRDPLHVRAVVVSDGTRTVALAAVDSIGITREDVLDVRRRIGWADQSDRYLLLAATHDHSAPDTLGLWGRFPGVSGVNPRYHERLKRTAAELIKELSGRLQEAEIKASSSVLDPQGLEIVYDGEKEAYVLIGEVELEPRERKTIEVELRNVWQVSDEISTSIYKRWKDELEGAGQSVEEHIPAQQPGQKVETDPGFDLIKE